MKRFFQRRWKVLASVVLVVVVLLLAGAWAIGGLICAPANHRVADVKGLAVESVEFASDSGATIHGWLVAPATNHGVVILQHGIRGCRRDMQQRARFLSRA